MDSKILIPIRSALDLSGAILRSRRDQHVRQQDLADLAGVSCRFLSDLENGKPSVELSKVFDVLKALGIDIAIVPRDRSGSTNA